MGIKKENTKNVVDKLNSYALTQKNIEYIEKKLKIIESELSKIKVSKLEENWGGVNNYRIENMEIYNFWGDGIYIGRHLSSNRLHSFNGLIKNVESHNNRRQGLSIVSAIDLLVERCIF